MSWGLLGFLTFLIGFGFGMAVSLPLMQGIGRKAAHEVLDKYYPQWRES